MPAMQDIVRVMALGGLIFCLPIRAGADPRPSARPPATPPPIASPQTVDVELSYSAYVAGLNMLRAEAGLRLDPDRYRIGLAFHTAGTVGLLLHGNDQTLSQGVIQGADVLPTGFVSQGLWKGEDRRTEIEYRDGTPVIRALVPPNDSEREPVPDAMQRGTVDTLGAIVALVHHVATNGTC